MNHAHLVKALENCSSALRYAQTLMPLNDPLSRKMEATAKATRTAIDRAKTAPKPLNVKNVAVTAMFMMEGFMSAERKLLAGGSDTPAWMENNGALDTITELAQYAEISERELTPHLDNEDGFPGVYEYEVADPFGEWWFNYVAQHGTAPTVEAGTLELKRRIAEFFAQNDEPGVSQ